MGDLMSKRFNLSFLAAAAALVAALLWAPAGLAQDDIRTMSTGVGEESRDSFSDYSLRLSFAEVDGPYIADVDVKIYDGEGNTVVDEHSPGPWFLADLPPGQYRVVATDKTGEKQGARFSVAAGEQTVIRLAWRTRANGTRY